MQVNISTELREELKLTIIEPIEDASDYTNFSQIPHWIMSSKVLSANEKIVYSLLYTFNTNRRPNFGSNKFIASSTGLTESGVQAILTKLEGHGLIRRTYIDGESIKGRKRIDVLVPTYDGREVYLRSSIPLSMDIDTPIYDDRYPLSMTIDHTNKETNKVTKKDSYNQSKNSGFVDFINKFNEATGRSFKGDSKSRRQFNARLKEGYSTEQLIEATKIAYRDEYHKETKFKYLTPEFMTRPDKLERFINTKTTKSKSEDLQDLLNQLREK